MNPNVQSLFDAMADAEKEAFARSFSSRDTTIAETSKVIRETVIVLRQRNWKTHEMIWNACLFLNTVAYDLSVLIFDLVYERDDWRRRLVARNLSTLLFETAEDLPTVFGRDFNQSLSKLNVPTSLRDSFREQLKKVSLFWDNHRAQLKSIRLICGAHRDHDAITMHTTIDKLDLFETLRIGVQLGSILNELGSASQAILNVTPSTAPPEAAVRNA